MRLLSVLIVSLIGLSSKGQKFFPDSVAIIKYTYTNTLENEDNLFKADTYSIDQKRNGYWLNGNRILKSKIARLFAAVTKRSDSNSILAQFNIDTSWIMKDSSLFRK